MQAKIEGLPDGYRLGEVMEISTYPDGKPAYASIRLVRVLSPKDRNLARYCPSCASRNTRVMDKNSEERICITCDTEYSPDEAISVERLRERNAR